MSSRSDKYFYAFYKIHPPPSSLLLERREFHDVAVEIGGWRIIVQVEGAAVRAEQEGGSRRRRRCRRRNELVEEVEWSHRLALLVPVAYEEVVATADDRRPRWAPGGRQPEDAMRLGRRRWRNQGHTAAGQQMLLSDFTRSTRFCALSLSLSSLYTGSSRHRVARLSTLFHRIHVSLSHPIPFSFFLSLSLSSLTPPLSVRIVLSAFHYRSTAPVIPLSFFVSFWEI